MYNLIECSDYYSNTSGSLWQLKLNFQQHGGEKCILSGGTVNNAGVVQNARTAATFKMTDAKIYVPVVTLSTEDNVKLTKQLNDGFERYCFGTNIR